MTATTSPAGGNATRPATLPARGFAAFDPKSPLGPFTFERRAPGPRDVQIDILFCGVCHSDLHTARSEWQGTTYPVVPGHEILGRVVNVGAQVTKFKKGDLAAVGCMVDSCRTCPDCRDGLEQYCQGPATFTYNGPDAHLGGVTYGGYSTSIVVDHDFVLRVSDKLDPAGAAPLLCAGITTWSPLRHWKVGPGTKVGVVGLGGLGHMGVKLAHALGAHVVLFTGSPGKTADAKRLGADEVVVTRNADEVGKHANGLDFILNTVSAQHNLDVYLNLLKRDGTMCLVGAPEHPHPSPSVMALIFRRRALAGSLIGGIRETQEMLDFCAEHNIVSDVEVIPMQKINEAYERMLKSDVRYRFVVDLASIK
jgi:uncharacterized zinc-type alcohol dehydrogenase-like protein